MKKLYFISILTLTSIALIYSCSTEEEDTSPPPSVVVTPEPEPPPLTQYTLIVTAGEGGTVSTEGGTYDEGTEVTVTATPNEGYEFAGWEGSDSTEASLIISLNSNENINALFEAVIMYNYRFLPSSLNSIENRLPYFFNQNAWDDFYPEDLAIFDYNNDGNLDVIHSDSDKQNSILGNRIRRNFRFYLGDGNGNLIEDIINKDKFEGLIHSRKSIVGDWNNDGWMDLFFSGTGPDSQQPNYIPNEHPIMLINDTKGSFNKITLNNQFGINEGYFHSVTSSDIDKDGISEILLIEPKSDLVEQSIIIEFDGNTGGNWGNGLKITPIDISNEDVKNKFTSESLDLDGNGNIELLLGGQQSDNGSFVYDLTTKTKRYIPHKKDLLIDAVFHDIDNDGDLDIIASTNTMYYEGMIEIFRNDIDTFADVTEQYIDENFDYQNHNQQWIQWLYLGDFDGNNILELHTSDSKDYETKSTTDIWWFEGGKFIKKTN